ncbi:MAG: hypothetical protein FJ147_07520 [Deltaproteobacteria bacterium]|nr:hypothetical protein [Deltaproteobacteria bacterium]
MGKKVIRVIGSGLLTLSLLAPGAARADFSDDAGMGTATVLANVVYMPTKLVYATLGGITGGFAYLLTVGSYSAAERVWTPSLGGNYVLNPEHLRGQDQIYFSGPLPSQTQQSAFR